MASLLAHGCLQSLLLVASLLPRRNAEVEMSQGVLFAFGCVIFFIVATGGFLFAMMSVRETADRSREATG